MSHKLHIVTGIPGTRVKLSLDKLVQYASDRDGTPVTWISLDEEVFSLAKPHVEKIWGMTGSALAPLLLPRPFLRRIWRDAFLNVWRKVERKLDSSNVILTCHLCYFHHLTREYLLPSDFSLLVEKLSSRASCIITLMTAIDELRLQPSDDGPTGNLDLRWPFTPDSRELLYTPPTNRSNPVAYPTGWENDEREAIPHSLLVAELRDRIMAHITARDHKLVEQSEVLGCMHPLFQGNRSGGVEEELRHVRLLMALDVRDRTHGAVVLNLPEDRAEYPARQLADRVVAWTKSGLLLGKQEDANRLALAIRERSVERLDQVLDGEEEALYEMCSTFNLEIATQGGGVLAEGAMGATNEARRDLGVKNLAEGLRDLKSTYLDSLESEKIIRVGTNEASFLSELGC